MDNFDYWKAFEGTGKISDYLEYKNNISEEDCAFGGYRNDGADNQGTEGWRI